MGFIIFLTLRTLPKWAFNLKNIYIWQIVSTQSKTRFRNQGTGYFSYRHLILRFMLIFGKMIKDSLELKVILVHLDNSSANGGHLTLH